jgi:hypothetical protein
MVLSLNNLFSYYGNMGGYLPLNQLDPLKTAKKWLICIELIINGLRGVFGTAG